VPSTSSRRQESSSREVDADGTVDATSIERGDTATAECVLPDGRTLAYATCGPTDGTPVVAHHGTPGSRLFADLLADAARDAGVRLLVPDRPGFGRSSAPHAGYGWTDWRDDLDALLDDTLASLARVPLVLRALFRASNALARVRGPAAVVGQYTDRDVSESVAAAVADDFHEAFARGARATEREFRLFA
jgi:hypothetical protein